MTNSIMVDSVKDSSEERSRIRADIERANAEASQNWHDPKWRREMAMEMTTTIYEGFEHENLLDLITVVEDVGFNDRVFVKEVRGLRAFWVARGGHIEASTMKSEVAEIPRDTVGFHAYEFEDKLMTNFVETTSDLVDLGIRRLDAEVNSRVLSLFQAAIPSSSAYYVSSSGVDLTTLNAALRNVRDESKMNEVAIVGRSTMTDQIMDKLLGTSTNGSGFLPETNEDMIRRGVLGTYRGARIITLVNHKDDEDVSFWPANEMYIVGRDASKMAFWGGLMSKEYSEGDNWYWHYIARRDFGGFVHHPERVRRYVDTSLTP